MTPNPARGQYYCHRARVEKGRGHGKAAITERAILPWIKDEAARLRLPGDALDTGSADQTVQRGTLEAQRDRLRTQHRLGVINDDELAVGWADIRAALDELDAREAVNIVDMPEAIDWEHDPPEQVNRALRSIWRHVDLDVRLHPVAADWKVPQWRA